jgi:hypothetical protein
VHRVSRTAVAESELRYCHARTVLAPGRLDQVHRRHRSW